MSSIRGSSNKEALHLHRKGRRVGPFLRRFHRYDGHHYAGFIQEAVYNLTVDALCGMHLESDAPS